MRAAIEIVLYVVVGGFLAALVVVTQAPHLSGRAVLMWVLFILFGAPLLLMLACLLFGINM